MILPGFLGPSARSRAYTLDNERTVNLYPELREKGNPKSGMALLPVPCCVATYSLPAGPIRDIYSQDGECWAVAGTAFCELFANGAYIVRGTVAADAYPATISSNGQNGHQLFITSGGLGYIYDLITKDIEQITDDGFPYPVASGGFVASSFVVLQRSTNKFYFSALNNGLVWSGLDVAQTSLTADDKIGMTINHGEVWLWGTQRSEIWVPQVGGSSAFAPIPGTIIESGTIAGFSPSRLDNTIYLLGGDERGANIAYRMNGYTPERVSTHAIETYLNSLPGGTSGALSWTYQEEGHAFYVLQVPNADTTLVYDVATDLWHQRALWDTDLIRDVPDYGRCHTFVWGRHLVGDQYSGTVFVQRLDASQDVEVAA